MEIKFAIIGCGLIGKKRLMSLPKNSVSILCDTNLQSAQALQVISPKSIITTNPSDVFTSDVDAVIISTPNNLLYPYANTAIQANKHVLLEKPGSINVNEISRLEKLNASHNKIVRVGYNHRFHPSCLKALEIFNCGFLGEAMFVRGRYGHGGRLGYETEWRANPKISGGGELIDQGVHIIDLASLFLGEFTKVDGHTTNSFWNMPVEDNAFLNLRNDQGKTAWLHVSCSEWKNLFSLEIYGKLGKLHWEGLGGSYGVEKLTYYKMLPQMGPPETTTWEYPQQDGSWKLEMNRFIEDITRNENNECNLTQARQVLNVVETIYKKL